jgi:PIN domain nuclease of toxin-antitoxin system
VAAVAYADTHVVAWLFAGRTEELSRACRETLERSHILVSPMVALELDYLHETGRVTEPATAVLEEVRRSVGVELCSIPFGEVIAHARRQSWTRDSFDRIIVGQAAVNDSTLITKDRSIRRHYAAALW